MFEEFKGEIAGLGAALAWAIASILYRRLGTAVPPLALNLYKGVAATAMLLVVLAARSELGTTIRVDTLGLLFVSGVIGIGVGDTAFFASLNRLGARRTVLMAETLAPPVTTFIAFVALSEVLSPIAFLGIAITIAGVAWVIVEQMPTSKIDGAKLKLGIAYGLLAAFCQAVGAVLSRAALTQAEIGPLWSSMLRIGGGILLLLIWMPLSGQAYLPDSVREKKPWRAVLVATFIGTFLGIFLQQLSLQNTRAGVAQTLLATSSLFVLPLVALRGEPVSVRAAFGAIVAVGGIALLFLTA